MAVKDIYSAGGRLPDPGDLAKETVESPQTDVVAKVAKAAADGAAIRSFMEASGLQSHAGQQPPTKAEEKFGVTLDIAKILESQSAMTNAMFTQITELMKNNMAAQQSTQLQQVQHGLAEIQRALQTPSDPFQSFLDNQEKFKKLMELMKSTAEVPSGIALNAGSAADFSTVLELTKLNMAMREADRRWEAEKLDRTEKLELDKMRLERDFQLKLMELKDGRERKDEAKDLLGTIAAAVVAGMDGKDGAQVTQAQQVALKPVRVPKTFTCEQCGEKVQVESSQATGAVCGQCGAEYTFAER